jgi:hypothetical protein
MRQGRKFQILGKYRGLDTVQVAERIIACRDKHSPNAILVDGDGLGAGVVDQLQHRGYNKGLFEFHGGERPRDFNMYFNRLSEVGASCVIGSTTVASKSLPTLSWK